MNNRDYKEFAPGEIFHIYNRGVGKMNIFNDEEDYEVFLSRLKENLFPELGSRNRKKSIYRRKILPPNSFDLISYCLMPNHFHLVIQQNSDLPISTLILKICTSFSKYFNKKYDRVGSLFQDAFKAVLIETNEQLLWVSLYVHENPSKAGLISNILDYKWSSLLDYTDSLKSTLCRKNIILEQFSSPQSYLEYFKDPALMEEVTNNMIGQQDLLIDE